MTQEGREQIPCCSKELEEEEEETRKWREKIKKEKEELKQKLEAKSSDIYLVNSDDSKAEEIQETQTTKDMQYETVICRGEEADTIQETAFSLQEANSDEEKFILPFPDTSDEENSNEDYPDENVKSKKNEKKLSASTQQCQLNTQEDGAKKFNKRPGFAKICGVLYEVKMCMLVFLRLLNLKAIFSLCSNMKEAEDFDDVVYYHYNTENKDESAKQEVENKVDSEAVFIQLKHADNKHKRKSILFYKNSPDFKLLDYFLSFSLCDSRVDPEHEIFSSDPDKRLYIIFTNANVDTTLLVEDTDFKNVLNIIIKEKVFKLKESKEWEEFKEFLKNLHRIFDESSENKEEAVKEINNCINTGQFIVKGQKRKGVTKGKSRSLEDLKQYCEMYKDINVNETNTKKFFSKLRICCCQTEVFMMDKLIKDEINTALTVLEIETETVLTKLQNKFLKWHDLKSNYLIQGCKIWADISKETRHMRSKNMEMRNLEIKFDDNSVRLMKEKLMQFSFLKIIAKAETTTLSTLKTWQALESLVPETYLLVSIKDCTNDVWNAWPNKWCKTLAIEFDTYCEDVQILTEKLTTGYINNPLAHVIIICPQSNTFKTEHNKDIADNVSFSQLEKESKKHILSLSKINFQGSNVSLGRIFKEKHIEMLGIDQLTSLIKNELTLGKDISDYYQKGYISRNIEIPYMGDQIFQIRETSTVVAIQLSDQPEDLLREYKIYNVQDLINLCSENPAMHSECCYVTLKKGKEMQEFDELCDTFSNVHWVEHNGEIFVCKRSKGEMYSIRNCINYSNKICKEERDFLDTSHQIPVVISGEPGMGKSSLLKNMALLLQEKHPYKWIVLVELAQYCKFFKNCSEMTKDKMYEFLIKALHLKFEISFFIDNPEILKNFIILLDGFDEVCPHYIYEAEKLAQHLKQSSYFLCITCRESYCSYLEEKFSVISYRTESLNNEMKEKLLIQCLEGESECLTQDSKYILSYINDQFNSFTGNPLSLLMLFEICDLENTKLEKGDKMMHDLNILQVFTKYIEKKCERFHREKTCCDNDRPRVIEEIKRNIEDMIAENKRKCAHLIFYDELEVESCEYKKGEMSDCATNYSRNIGIIQMIGENDFVYTHKLFVEYFAALWLVDNFKQNESIVKKIMFERGFETVRQFFDLKCSESSELHTAILTKDIDFVKNLTNQPSLSDTIDVMGRTALHLAAINNDASMIQLLKNYIDVNIKDNLGHTPLDYAICACSWESMNVLLGSKEFTESEHYKLWKRLDRSQGDIIFRCCMGGLEYLLKFVSKHVDLNNYFVRAEEDISYEIRQFGTRYISNPKRFIPIEVADEFGQKNIVKLLQKYNCDINVRVHCEFYNVKMCMFLSLRLINLETSFSLYSNFVEARAFGDGVVHYKYNNEYGGDVNGTLFIMLKYGDVSDRKMTILFYKDNPYFKLSEYFVSYSLSESTVPNTFSCDSDKRLYLLFTSADVDRTSLCEDTDVNLILHGITKYGKIFKVKESEPYKNFLKFISNLHSIFHGSSDDQEKATKEINRWIATEQSLVQHGKQNRVSSTISLENLKKSFYSYKDMNVDKITNFFLKLRICCCQPNVNELDDIIKHEIQAALSVSETDTETVFTTLFEKFKLWHRSYYLTENSKIWTDISKATRDVRPENTEMRNSGVKFDDDESVDDGNS